MRLLDKSSAELARLPPTFARNGPRPVPLRRDCGGRRAARGRGGWFSESLAARCVGAHGRGGGGSVGSCQAVLVALCASRPGPPLRPAGRGRAPLPRSAPGRPARLCGGHAGLRAPLPGHRRRVVTPPRNQAQTSLRSRRASAKLAPRRDPSSCARPECGPSQWRSGRGPPFRQRPGLSGHANFGVQSRLGDGRRLVAIRCCRGRNPSRCLVAARPPGIGVPERKAWGARRGSG